MKLCGMRSYLCGAMDRVQDGGVGWRNDITPFLEELGVVVLNPCLKQDIMDENSPLFFERTEDRQRIHRLKNEGQFDKLQQEIKCLRVSDLRMVDISDFLIVNIDVDIHACGTYEEISWANRLKHPVLIHVEQGKKNCPNWLLGMVPHQHIFDEWSELKNYLLDVHHGKDDRHFKRWIFFDLSKPTVNAMLKASEQDEELHDMVMDYALRFSSLFKYNMWGR